MIAIMAIKIDVMAINILGIDHIGVTGIVLHQQGLPPTSGKIHMLGVTEIATSEKIRMLGATEIATSGVRRVHRPSEVGDLQEKGSALQGMVITEITTLEMATLGTVIM